MASLIKTKENVERSIRPFHEFYNGSKTPYGRQIDDGEFHILHDAISRYGYQRFPIWAVLYSTDKTENMRWSEYKFFIGEAPHKDERGDWSTYNDVPTFICGSFGGCDFIDKEPDIPHIIDIQTDELRHYREVSRETSYDEMQTDYRKIKYRLEYCTFKDYLKGLRRRIRSKIGGFTKYTGERYKYVMFSRTSKRGYFGLSLFKKLDGSEVYFQREDNDWIRFLYLKKDNKICIKFSKQPNSGDCEAC